MTLVGRDAEQDALAGLLDAARSGVGGVLLLRGEAGIGKSALLAWAVAHADDMTVLRADGVEPESPIAFASLSTVLAPLQHLLPEIPSPQVDALRSALALGPPTPASPLGVLAGAASLLAVGAEERPVLVVVDDVQWIDAPSRGALMFAARRLQLDPVAFLFAGRLDDTLA